MKTLTTLTLAASLCLSMQVRADDVSDQITEAQNAYKSGNLENTITALDAAATLVRQKRAGAFAEALPKPLAGWVSEQEEARTSAAGAMFGGGVNAERVYREQKEDNYKQVTISITGDSPMLQGMAMLFTNPMLMGSQTQKLVVMDGRKVLQDSSEGSLTLMLNGKLLVQVRGGSNEPATMEAVKNYFKAIDFKKLEALAK